MADETFFLYKLHIHFLSQPLLCFLVEGFLLMRNLHFIRDGTQRLWLIDSLERMERLPPFCSQRQSDTMTEDTGKLISGM